MSVADAPLRVFCSFAQEDATFGQQLYGHLRLLERQGVLDIWHTHLITAGTHWAEAIDMHLNNASIILLLISPDFFASDYHYGIEMQTALNRHQAHEARVIPVLLRPTDWKGAPFAHLQALPADGKPITTWQDQDAAFVDVVTGIRRAIEELSQVTLATSARVGATLWNVPYLRNPFFTGRDDLLAILEQALHAGQPTLADRIWPSGRIIHLSVATPGAGTRRVPAVF